MAVTVAYLYPSAGAVPTAAIAAAVTTVIATILPTSSTDASATITHNWGLPASDITSGFPLVSFQPLDNIGAAQGLWFVVSQNPNYTVLGKNTSQGTDSVAQVQVNITRPHTYVR
jgi:hypothetical protein